MGTIRYLLVLAVLSVLLACSQDSPGPVAPSVDPEPQQPGPVADPVAPDQSQAPPDSEPVPPAVETPPEPSEPVGVDEPVVPAADPVEPPVEVEGPQNSPVPLPTPSGANPVLEGTFLDIDEFPVSQIVSGGVAKDGIPALTNPSFVSPSQVNYLNPDDLVLGVTVNGEAKAYPHNIGWWHEIVNDRIGGLPISVTFCPLTGTGLVFNALDAETGRQIEFGVSGLLFNNNLIMYDRRDGSTLYPQLLYTAVLGPRQHEALELLPVVETTWAMWQRLYPNTRVVERGSYSIDRYLDYPYGGYRTDNTDIYFGLLPSISRNGNAYADLFGEKDRVLGVRLDGATRAYPFRVMGERRVINDQLGGVQIVVLWDRESRLAIPYARQVDGQVLTFIINTVQGTPFSMIDRETESLWTATGLAVDGPLTGKQLTQVPAHNGFWFAWVTFWQNTDVWSGQEG
ncbi:MAG: DUF3179 domain-containing protein [Candidatus Latescibacteria bacterium]|nr:DUF3179 domain-containing protein [Candidatus Latescibacterota bacterium]